MKKSYIESELAYLEALYIRQCIANHWKDNNDNAIEELAQKINTLRKSMEV